MNPEPARADDVVTLDPHAYVSRILDWYRCTPGTLGQLRRHDRLVAADLHRRRVPLAVVESALLLAAARRSLRPDDAPPLPPVRSLAYFLPVVDELLAAPLDPDYVRYLRSKLAAITPGI